MAESQISTVARPYARAAFAQALDEASGLANWSRMLNQLAATLQHPTVVAALDDPLLTMKDEAALVIRIMAEELSEKGRNFVHILAANGRLVLIPQISEMYDLLKANHEKIMDVEIISAFEVNDADRKILGDALRNKLQREINLSATIDSTLIGGVVIRTEDTVIDNSIRGRLDKLSNLLG